MEITRGMARPQPSHPQNPFLPRTPGVTADLIRRSNLLWLTWQQGSFSQRLPTGVPPPGYTAWALQNPGGPPFISSRVVQFNIYLAVLALSCSLWDLIPWPGMEALPPALGGRVESQPLDPQGSPWSCAGYHSSPAQGSQVSWGRVPFSNLPLPGQLGSWGWAELISMCLPYSLQNLLFLTPRTWSDTVCTERI